MAPPMDPDAPLTTRHVHRARAGDGESLNWLVRRFTPLLTAQAEYRLGQGLRQTVDPADLVQEVWLTALPRLPELDAAAGTTVSQTAVLMKFLGTTLLYKVNNLLRQRIRRDDRAGDAAAAGGAPVSAQPEPTRGIVSRAIANEAHRIVHETIRALPERDREVVVLRAIEQHTNQEAAAILGQSTNAVSLRYNRALEKLRAALPDSVFSELPDDPT